jgi:hypothetical protein
VQYHRTTTNPVSCSLKYKYSLIHTHTLTMYVFLSLHFFLLCIELRAHIRGASVTASRTGLDRCRDWDGRRRGETWAAATTVWNYLPPPQAEYTFYIICIVCVFQAQGLCGQRYQMYWVEGACTSREPRGVHEIAAVRTGVFPRSFITFSDFRQIILTNNIIMLRVAWIMGAPCGPQNNNNNDDRLKKTS